ncbi:unnamed protein product [Rotaria magnacalcarata]|uniref:Methyltransferase type 11 domain-containing protein n=1 Tax=Rotaria magnacalcarata TaxID=392030 RepID=A0A814TVW8_9BILA|nr:unnamed protein product [Rotaria magnacalcarata]CAF1450313.1 unnamed protein product [Rotaria magnacalcarata]CAF2017987.1 unnamed protein product [Rotaria magnacalcarata]CAF2034949.1 unnamed protein product [Rotaria magnacalcarata]
MNYQNRAQPDVLEQIYVHDVYNRLDSTTLTQDTTAWPNVRKFLNRIASQNKNALVADVGCGTGKYIKLKSDLFTIGCDRSNQLCEIAREKYSHIPIVIADNLYLPYRDNLFDAVLSIGVIHHLTTHQRRLKAIQECLRILKLNGGQLLIYTWAMEQKQRQFSSQDVLVPCSNQQSRSDIIRDKSSWSSSCHIQENLLRRIEQVDSQTKKTATTTTLSMLESMQNLFQRIIKPASSTPSTPKLSHQDQLKFRLRPFPMSSFDDEQINLNPCNNRFYHVFKQGELEMLIEEASKAIAGAKIIKSYYDHGNWCAIVQRDIDVGLL